MKPRSAKMGPRWGRDGSKWAKMGAKLAQRVPGTGTLKIKVPVPDLLLAQVGLMLAEVGLPRDQVRSRWAKMKPR